MADQPRTMIVRYTNGTAHKFQFPSPKEDQFNLVARLQELLSQKHILLEMQGRLVVIPFTNIQYIEISPAPEKLPPNAIKDATLAK